MINLVTLGKALGLSEPVVRERARRDEFAELGIRVLRLGAQYWCRQPDVLRFLGIDSPEHRAERARKRAAASDGGGVSI